MLPVIRAMKEIPHVKLKSAGAWPFREYLKRACNKRRFSMFFLRYLGDEMLNRGIRDSVFVVRPGEC